MSVNGPTADPSSSTMLDNNNRNDLNRRRKATFRVCYKHVM